MDSTNQFSQEVEQDTAVQPQQPPANPVGEELNDTELDAIAGGFMGWLESGGFDQRERLVYPVAGKKAG